MSTDFVSHAQLPPSERDFEVYELVAVEAQSTRKAAALVGLSQTRVMQIHARVAEWLAAQTPQTARLTAAQRLVVGRDLAERRMNHLYGESMESWRESKGEETTHRVGGLAGEVRVTRQSHGDVKYLNQAMRITERTVRMAADLADREAKRAAKTPTRRASEASTANPTAAIDPILNSLPPIAPPIGACSPPSESEMPWTAAAQEQVAPNDCSDTTCDDAEDRRREFLTAIHVDSDTVQSPVLERAAAPRTSRQLNRQERRARQRRLEQAMRRAK